MTLESTAKRQIHLIEFLLVNLFLIVLTFAFVCSLTIAVLFFVDAVLSLSFCLVVAILVTFIIYPKKYSYTIYDLVFNS